MLSAIDRACVTWAHRREVQSNGDREKQKLVNRTEDMKINRFLLVGGLAAVMTLGAGELLAQNNPGGGPPGGGGFGGGPGGGGGRGNWDPAQFQQRMMDRYKESLEITDDAEWKAIQPLIQKVMDARMATMSGMGRGMFGRGPRPGGDNQGDQGQRRSFGGNNPEADTLQKAIDSKASSADLKAALQKYAGARKQKQADLEKAQDDLRKVLTPRQEAIASLSGLL
jgi:hypothetical protein